MEHIGVPTLYVSQGNLRGQALIFGPRVGPSSDVTHKDGLDTVEE